MLPSTVHRLIAEAAGASMGVCRYADGRGHPLWLGRPVFSSLELLHGDKGVWKLLESGKYPVVEVAIDVDVQLDVDTREDSSRLLEQDVTRPSGA